MLETTFNYKTVNKPQKVTPEEGTFLGTTPSKKKYIFLITQSMYVLWEQLVQEKPLYFLILLIKIILL